MSSINAVIVGTFTLRFSTGLTGAMLAFYLAKLPEFGGPQVSGTVAGILTATYFAAELVLSPVFGILSDRVGAHRVMQIGPVFGAVAVIITAFTTDLWLIGGTRWLEGMAAAAAMPSILGYIAITTSGNAALRGRTVARFEAATIAGLGVGAVVGRAAVRAVRERCLPPQCRHLRRLIPHLPVRRSPGRGRCDGHSHGRRIGRSAQPRSGRRR